MHIGFEEQGSGPAVIMVHGLGGSSNTFQPQALRLLEHYRVIRPDLPGAGRSATLPAGTLVGVADMLAELASRLQVKSAHWIGHSLGTIICQIVAIRHPALVASLTLLGPIAEAAPAARTALAARAKTVRAQGLGWFVDTYIPAALAKSVFASTPATGAFLRESILRQSPEQYADFCVELSSHSAVKLESILAPTLLVTGDEDKVATVDTVTAMSKQLPTGSLRVLQECGHWLTVERPNEVTDAIVRHLRAVEGAR